MSDNEIREALNQHSSAFNSGDFAIEHGIYHEDAILDYPQSRERIVGRHNIQTTRAFQPSKKRFEVHRIMGSESRNIMGRKHGQPAESNAQVLCETVCTPCR